MLLDSADKILDIAKDFPPQINENSTMYFKLDSWVGAMNTINRQHEEAFIDLEFELKPEAPEKYKFPEINATKTQ
jgi:hypothetical protein